MSATKILVVDDDVDFAEATAAVLESAGYEVSKAHNGEEGLAQARADRPDLIILDVMMSYLLEGLSVGEEIQADPSLAGIPVLMVSAIARTEYLSQFPTDQALPARHFLTKPVASAELLRTVKWLLTEQRSKG